MIFIMNGYDVVACVFQAAFVLVLLQKTKRAPLVLCLMLVVALFFGPSKTGYKAGADHFNYDHIQWIRDGFVDGGECTNLRQSGKSCHGDGESVNKTGFCSGCLTYKKRKASDLQYGSDDDQTHADNAPHPAAAECVDEALIRVRADNVSSRYNMPKPVRGGMKAHDTNDRASKIAHKTSA